ncbi:MurR/RpiR family transcriptional regulator [Granulosicoccaceae sp. 1_MG-2023]|nr:MurR/RpiR family transcriptional regulator [Granulosicoccaceae sp. 1_MG-2023]
MLIRMQAGLEQLSKAEREVAEWALANPQKTVSSTIAQLSAATGVSEPTIIRYCRSLGFSGFREFKLNLAQALAGESAQLCRDISADDSADDLIHKITGGAINSLQLVRNQLDRAAAQQAIDLLHGAQKIEFYGQGGSGVVATDAAQKFFRFGVPCNVYTDPYLHGVAASLLDNRAVVVAISFSGRSTDIINSCRIAAKQGAPVIAITATGSPLAAIADVVLGIDIGEESDHYAPIKSRMAQLVVLDILSVGMAVRNEATLTQRLIKAGQALDHKYVPAPAARPQRSQGTPES